MTASRLRQHRTAFDGRRSSGPFPYRALAGYGMMYLNLRRSIPALDNAA